MSQYLSGNYYCLTDQGKVRKTNEDYAKCAINAYGNVLLIVADGMGGASRGDYASSLTSKFLVDSFLSQYEEFKSINAAKKWLFEAISDANEVVYSKAQRIGEYKGMGTTLSVCLIIKDTLITAQIGDSRIYWLKNDQLEQLSVDQTYVNYLINTKKLTPEEAITHPDRHKLTNALGTKEQVSVEIESREYNGEKLLLCSDGLYNNVPLKDMCSILKGDDSLDKKCLQLIAFGNANGGTDNMAVVIWEAQR